MPTPARHPAAPPREQALVARWLALGAIVLLAAVLRFATLRTQSIWFDEAATWDLVRRPFGEMLSRIPDGESNPPLFYALEWIWTRAVGDGEFGLRSLSALSGLLTVPVAYAIARHAAGALKAAAAERAGLAAAALVAVNPLLVWFSQEARSYALATLLSALALLLMLRAVDRQRDGLLAGWALVAALALATHYFTAFVLAPQALWLLWRHPHRRGALAAVSAVALAGLALLPLLLAQAGNPYDIAGTSLALRLVQLPKQFLLGYRGPLALLFGLLGAVLVAGGAWLLLRRMSRPTRECALLLAAIGGIAVALPLLAAPLGADYLNTRNLLPALIPLLAALGVAYGASAPARLGVSLLAALCALSLAIVISVARDAQYQRQDWKGLAHALGTLGETRAVVISPANGELALRYYRPGLHTMGAAGAKVREIDVVTVAGARDPGKAPRIPPLTATAPEATGFGPALERRTRTLAVLRFPTLADAAMPVMPIPLSAQRFGDRLPAVDVLPAGR
ncbi:MAG TPA: glycosyltransferase family 39 protein [Conexibacter sp.]|nr:glycosyltransferase family 39 protein [Conexibacter sp.]